MAHRLASKDLSKRVFSCACAQEVYAKIVFRGDDVRWNHRFCDVLIKKGGQFVVDFRTFHETTPSSGGCRMHRLTAPGSMHACIS